MDSIPFFQNKRCGPTVVPVGSVAGAKPTLIATGS